MRGVVRIVVDDTNDVNTMTMKLYCVPCCDDERGSVYHLDATNCIRGEGSAQPTGFLNGTPSTGVLSYTSIVYGV